MDELKGNVLIRSKVTPYIEDIRGGAGTLMMNLGRALVETGWNVHYLSPRPGRSTYSKPDLQRMHFHEFDYTNPTTLPERLIGSIRGRGKYLSVVTQNDIDIVIDDVSELPFYPAYFRSTSDVTNALFVHVSPFDDARQSSGFVKGVGLEMINRSLGWLGDVHFICAGRSTANRLQSYLDVNNTSVLNPCVDISNFEFEFAPDSKTVLYLGRITKRKNVSCLLKGWEMVENTYPDYELVVAGDGPLRGDMMDLASELGLQKVVFPGFVSEEEKIELFEEALIKIIPSYREGYVTTGIEALAAGTPVVGSDTRGINDYIVHGENGFLFDTNNPSDLAEMVTRILSEPEDLRQIAENGRSTSERHRFEEFQQRADEVVDEIDRFT